MNNVPEAIFALSPADKLKLIDELWESLSSEPEKVPLTEWQEKELDRRLDELEANPGVLLTWEEVMERVRSTHDG